MIAEPEPLYFESTGTGPPLVFAHGFSGSARNWRPQVRAFRGQNRVLVYDQRGHARSPAPHATPDRYSRAAFVADVAEILDREAISRAVACGLSLGAGVMLAFALAHPERVRGLVLASFPAGLGRAGAFSGSAQAMASVLESDGVEVAGARFVWGSESGLDERLAMPVLLVAGSRDTGSLEATRRLASRLPHARVELIEGAGHVVNLSATAAFNEILGDFLVDLPD
jgi:pimeloyl-ACP methyl ester carboxylesterase